MHHALVTCLLLAACGSPHAPAPISNTADPRSGARETASTEPTAAIVGTVRDKKTGEPSIGTTIVARSKRGTEEFPAITDEEGAYRLELPPGTYDVTFYREDDTAEHPNITVKAHATATLHGSL